MCVCQCVRFIEFRINALTFLQVSRGGGKSLHTSRRKSCADFKTKAKLMQHTQHVTTGSGKRQGGGRGTAGVRVRALQHLGLALFLSHERANYSLDAAKRILTINRRVYPPLSLSCLAPPSKAAHPLAASTLCAPGAAEAAAAGSSAFKNNSLLEFP